MRDLNYQLKQLCYQNRDGSYATQAQRLWLLSLIANQLHDLGFRQMTVGSLKPKHVEALTQHWLTEGRAVATIKNRMTALRWWATKVNRQNVIARSNDHYGIPDRQFVTNTSKAQAVTADALAKVKDPHVRMSLELQQAFGLRREEAIKFIPHYADRGDHLALKDTWTKGGKAREIPIRSDAQREVLDRAHHLAGRGSLIPPARNYVQQLRVYEGHTARAGLSKLHGLRHAYAQQRYEELTNRKAPAAGGPPSSSLSPQQRVCDTEFRVPGPLTAVCEGVPRCTDQKQSSRVYSVSATPRATSAWTATASTSRSGPTLPRSALAARAWPSIVLNSTDGSTTISPATDVPVDSKEP